MTSSTFAELNLSADTLLSVEQVGYSQPTPIQLEAVPALLSGRDVHLQAQTGTGKTAAFVLPLVDRMTAAPGRIEALVLTPTRELAQQVSEEFVRLGARRNLVATAIYGGTSFEKQYTALETAQIVVATPGRLLDLHRRGKLDLRFVKYFGLDEADEMLSMGFDRDVLEIAGMLPGSRQSFLCSATFNDPILRIAASITRDPITVNTSSDHVGAQSVKHVYFKVPEGTRPEALLRVIAQTGVSGAIVFCNTRAASFRVNELLRTDGRAADVLNGELSQSEREAALARMRSGDVDFLVATDVAARGIDISGLPAVINYDMPEAADVYIHRTGRTGRAGQAGVAYSVVCPGDITVFHTLQKTFKLRLEPEKIASESQIRVIRADRLLDGLLSDIDTNGKLRYAGFLPLAERLSQREDGIRLIAKLMAAYTDGPAIGTSVPATEPAAAATVEQSAAPAAREATAVEKAAPEQRPARTERAARTEAVATAPAAPAATVVAPVAVAEVAAATWEPVETESASPERSSRRGRARKAEVVAEQPTAALQPPAEVKAGDAPPKVESVVPAAPATAPSGGSANAAFDWLCANTQQRNIGRFFPVADIAAALGIEPGAVVALADAHEQIERARNGDPMWRLRRGALNDLFGPPPARPTPPSGATGATEARPTPAADRPRRDARPRNPEPAAAQRAVPPAPQSSQPRPPAPARPMPAVVGGFVVMRVNVGRDLIADPRELARQLVELSGFDREDVGRLELAADHCTLPVRSEYSADFVAALRQESLLGRRLQIAPLPS